MERPQNRVPAKTSPRTPRKRPSRQRRPPYRKTQLSPLRHGHPPGHPLSDIRTKGSLITRVVSLLTSTTSAVPEKALDKEGTQCRVMRAVCLVCAAYTASVLDNAFERLGYEEREAAFGRCDEVLGEFVVWPSCSASSSSNSSSGFGGGVTPVGRRRHASRIASGSGTSGGGGGNGRESILGLVQEVRKEMVGGDEDVGFELVVAVLEVLSKLDSLL